MPKILFQCKINVKITKGSFMFFSYLVFKFCCAFCPYDAFQSD